MESYYDILEVSNKASYEIIEKAYRTLAKKYHPDVQADEQEKVEAEEQMKKINEAYEILSDINKRAKYDEELYVIQEQKRQEEINKIVNKRIHQKNEEYNYNKGTSYSRNEEMQYKEEVVEHKNENNYYEEQTKIKNEAYSNAYNNAYYQYLRDLGYKIKTKKSLKERGKDILTILLTIGSMLIVFAILWLIPPIRKQLIIIYEGNPIFKFLVNIILGIFK